MRQMRLTPVLQRKVVLSSQLFYTKPRGFALLFLKFHTDLSALLQ